MMLAGGSIAACARRMQFQQRLLRSTFTTEVKAAAKRTRVSPKTKEQPTSAVLEDMPPVQVVRDPRGLAELLVQKMDDRALPQLLEALQALRKTPLHESTLNKSLKKVGLESKQVPLWFRKWLKTTLVGAKENAQPYPFAVPAVPAAEIENVVAQLGTYMFCLRCHKSDSFAAFLLQQDLSSMGLPARSKVLASLPLRRLNTSMEKAWGLAQSLDIEKLQFVLDTLQRHYRKEILREEVVSKISSQLFYHVDVLQPIYEHALGDRKRELSIFSEAKRFHRELLLRGLTKELKLVAVRSQQPDLNLTTIDESYELPVEALLPATEAMEPSESTRVAAARKSFNFLQQRMYIGIHHIFQMNVVCDSKLDPTVKQTKKQQAELAQKVEGGAETLTKVLDALAHPEAGVSMETYLQEVSTKSDEDDDAGVEVPNGNEWLYLPLTPEEANARFQARTQEYTALLNQLKDDDEAGGVRRDMAAAMAAVGLGHLSAEQQAQLWKIVEAQQKAKEAARVEAVRQQLPDASAQRKVTLTNLPRNVTEADIRNALRNVGGVDKVWIYCHDFVAAPEGVQKRLDKAAAELGEDADDEDPLTIFGADEAALALGDGDALGGGDGTSSSGGAGGSGAKKRRPIIRRKIVERMRMLGNKTRPLTDTYAFVTFTDDAAYQRALTDDMRIFGVSIQGNSCKVDPAARRTSFFIEMHYPMRVSHVMQVLNMSIGKDYHIKIERPTHNDRCKPVFVRLHFRSHEECWQAYHLLSQNQMIHDSRAKQPELPAEHHVNLGYDVDADGEVCKVSPAAWHLAWLRTRNFWELSLRARRSLEGLEYKHLTDTCAADVEQSRVADLLSRDLGSAVAFDGDAELDDVVVQPDEPHAEDGDETLPSASAQRSRSRPATSLHTSGTRVRKMAEDPFALDEASYPLLDDVFDDEEHHLY